MAWAQIDAMIPDELRRNGKAARVEFDAAAQRAPVGRIVERLRFWLAAWKRHKAPWGAFPGLARWFREGLFDEPDAAVEARAAPLPARSAAPVQRGRFAATDERDDGSNVRRMGPRRPDPDGADASE